MRLIWIILGTALAAACNGADDEASSDGQELSSNNGSDRDTAGSGTDSNSEGDTSGTQTADSRPDDGDTTMQQDATSSTQSDREHNTATSHGEPDGSMSEVSEAGAMTDEEEGDSGSGLSPGEAARIRCEAMDEEQCRSQKADGCVAIQGVRYVDQDACVESRFVKCTCMASASTECSSSCSDGLLIVYMQDDDDALWRFPTTCTPDEWQELATDDPMLSVFEGAAECAEE